MLVPTGQFSFYGPPMRVPGIPVNYTPSSPRTRGGAPVHVGVACDTPPRPVRPELDECARALVKVLEGSLSTGDLAPHIHPPFSSVEVELFKRVVLNIPAVANANANAAGILLRDAEDQFDLSLGTPIPAFDPPNTVFPWQPTTILAYQVPQGFVEIYKSWGILVEVGDTQSVRGYVQIQGGPNTGSVSPDPRTSGIVAGEQAPTMIILPETKVMTIKLKNLDQGSAVLCTFVAKGWRIPVREFAQTLKSMISRPGYSASSSCGVRTQ